VLLDPAEIIVNLHHAYRRPEFRDRPYACFHSGPSATADIEGGALTLRAADRASSC
jgi:L-lactate dehydrogenase complex protein LldG